MPFDHTKASHTRNVDVFLLVHEDGIAVDWAGWHRDAAGLVCYHFQQLIRLGVNDGNVAVRAILWGNPSTHHLAEPYE